MVEVDGCGEGREGEEGCSWHKRPWWCVEEDGMGGRCMATTLVHARCLCCSLAPFLFLSLSPTGPRRVPPLYDGRTVTEGVTGVAVAVVWRCATMVPSLIITLSSLPPQSRAAM